MTIGKLAPSGQQPHAAGCPRFFCCIAALASGKHPPRKAVLSSAALELPSLANPLCRGAGRPICVFPIAAKCELDPLMIGDDVGALTMYWSSGATMQVAERQGQVDLGGYSWTGAGMLSTCPGSPDVQNYSCLYSYSSATPRTREGKKAKSMHLDFFKLASTTPSRTQLYRRVPCLGQIIAIYHSSTGSCKACS